MAREGFDNPLTKLAALVSAAMVATSVTTWLVLFVAWVEDVIAAWQRSEPAEGVGSLLADLFFAPLLGIYFGIIGAALFLAAAFWTVRGKNRRAFLWAGVGAGVSHSLVGLILRAVDANIEPRGWLYDAVGWMAYWGGFLLTHVPRDIVVAATLPASAVAGALAGILYARIVDIPRQAPADAEAD